jgi:hypothetical protein
MNIYTVKLLHTFQKGNRTIEFQILLNDEEFENEETPSPESLAIQYAINKFYNSGYALFNGNGLEILSVDNISIDLEDLM